MTPDIIYLSQLMTPHVRKLLPAEGTPTHILTSTSPSPSSSLEIEEREKPTDYAANNNNSHGNGNPPFDSAMALTVLALLTALLFMSFFSIYIRHFASASDDESSSRRRRRRRSPSLAYFSITSSYHRSPRSIEKGIDPSTIKSLPVHAYGGGDAKQGIKTLEPEIECAICLSEFEKRDWVKEIPYCGHVFHVECIDTWLSSHVTCPLCRTVKFFPATAVEEEGKKEADEVEEARSGIGEVQENEVRLVVDEYNTWQTGGERLGVRRSSSCTQFGERVTLNRSLSF